MLKICLKTQWLRLNNDSRFIMEFRWLNEGRIVKKDNRIEIIASAQTDFFCGSIDECEEGILPESLYKINPGLRWRKS